ncbi:hypothetical protein Ndes2437B_g04572 [Nannochloris sp. 'desiccata']
MIRGHLKRQPTLSLLLLGPKNSGKSELIKILKEKEGPRMLHIDLRMHDTSSPALMAQQLHKQARKLPNVLAIIDAYNTTLDNLPPGQRKPVIVIDEANALQLWKVEDSVALKQFLEFLKASCKQYHTAHVILASSEFFMLSWLDSQGYDETFVLATPRSAIAGSKAWLRFCQGLKRLSLKL